jgi:predicted component of type VI protein secretion system
MPIQVTVHPPESLARDPMTLQVDADPVVIGRSPDAHVHLDDPSRVVSKEHAEIRRTAEGYRIVDLGSKNFTFLDGVQLEPGRSYPIGSGESIQIGDFELAIRIPRSVASSRTEGFSDETVFAADFQNPFEDVVSELSRALHHLADTYDREATGRREDALRDAIAHLDPGAAPPTDHPAVRHALSLLGPPPNRAADGAPPSQRNDARQNDDGGAANVSSPSSRPPDSPYDPPSDPPPDAPSGSSSGSSSGEDAEIPPFISADAHPQVPDLSFRDSSMQDGTNGDAPHPASEGASVDDASRALVHAVSRLITIPWQFRHEFIGQTILQAPESAFLYDTPERLQRHLLGPQVPPDERRRRLDFLQDAVDAVVRHQIAMLDGYKASVTLGAGTLLEHLDPATHLEASREVSLLHRWVPPLAATRAIDRLREQYEEMQHGTWSVAERRVFRPAFIKAYLARMTAA